MNIVLTISSFILLRQDRAGSQDEVQFVPAFPSETPVFPVITLPYTGSRI